MAPQLSHNPSSARDPRGGFTDHPDFTLIRNLDGHMVGGTEDDQPGEDINRNEYDPYS